MMKKFALFAICVVVVSACGHVDDSSPKLDASNGFDARYYASLENARARMSKQQLDAFHFVVQGIAENYFISKYGRTPSVQQVFDGEAGDYEKALRSERLVLEKRLKQPEAVYSHPEYRIKEIDEHLRRLQEAQTLMHSKG